MKTAICGSILLLVSISGASLAQSASNVHLEDLRSKTPSIRRQAARGSAKWPIARPCPR